MTQDEIEFNKRCAIFRGWKNMGMVNLELWVSSKRQKGKMTSELKFHSDWNWIMDVKDKICQLDIVDEFITRYDSVGKGYHCFIHPYYKGSFEVFCTSTFLTEKEAVVSIINEFLIWYKK